MNFRGHKQSVAIAGFAFSIFLTANAALAGDPGQVELAANEPIKLRLAGYLPVKHYITKAMENFEQSVEQESKGHIVIEHYPAATLFKTTNLHQAVGSGQIQMGYGTTAWFADQLPAMGIMDLPFLFESQQQVEKALTGDFGAAMSKITERADMKIIGWLDLGFANALGTNKVLVKRPDDLKGLRIRAYGVFPALTIQALGGAPTTISSKETYTALQRGVVDGAVSLVTSFHSRNWYEVVDNITVVPLAYVVFGIYANLDWWNGLSDQDKTVMEEAAAKASKFTFTHTAKANKDSIAFIKGAGKTVYEVPKPDYGIWKKKVDAVYAEYKKQAGEDGQKLLDLARKYQ